LETILIFVTGGTGYNRKILVMVIISNGPDALKYLSSI